MTVVEIRCPNCGSPSATKEGNGYVCDHCHGKFQIVFAPAKKDSSSALLPQIKYGRIGFKLDTAEFKGIFKLEPPTNLTYTPLQVFSYHAYKRIVRGSRTIEANEFGYVFLNPFTGTVYTYLNKDNKPPESKDCKSGVYQECMKIITADAFEDKPMGDIKDTPNALSLASLQNSAFDWITRNLIVEKTYVVQQTKRADLGVRGVKVKFSKKEFDRFDSVGCFAIPIFDLSYRHPSSTKIFKRTISGYSGEILHDELRCSKARLSGRKCQVFPDYVCVICGNLICAEHSKQCEKCGAYLCKDCAVSKGVISKHYYCSKCG